MVSFHGELTPIIVYQWRLWAEFPIPDEAPRVWPHINLHANPAVSQLITKKEPIYFHGTWGRSEHMYLHPNAPGYDLVSWETWGKRTTVALEILNPDGTLPAGGMPVAHDDVLTMSALSSHFLNAETVLDNDDAPVMGMAFDIEVRPTSSRIAVDFEPWLNYGSLLLASRDGFIGTAVAEYRFMDGINHWSNWGKIFVDFIGDNVSRDDIRASDEADTVDFSLSHGAVGIHGLGGDDLIRGSQAGDVLNGDDGADRIGGKDGNDILNGGNGHDLLFGDAGNDTIDGGADDDTAWGGDGNDVLRGGSGNDQLFGDGGDDQLAGKAGDDALHGGAGNDVIWGDDGHDVLYGDAGNDALSGGPGDDILTGGLGIDRMRGGAGIDTFIFMRGEAEGDTILDFEGAGVVGGDKIEFRGYGAGASLHHVSGDIWQIDAAGISETFRIAGVENLSKLDFYFT